MSNKQQIPVQEEQLSSKDLILKFIHLKDLIANEWRLVLIFMAIGALLSLVIDRSKYRDTQYSAEIVFNLEGGSTNAGGGDLASFASALGYGGGGVKTADLFSGDNFQQVIQSRAVYERALMKEVKVYGKTLLLANYFKDSSDISKKEWAGTLFKKPNSIFINYRFTQKDPEDLSKLENEIIGTMYDKLKNSTDIKPLSKTSSLTSISSLTNSEMLSKVWVETLVKTMEEFYKEVRTKKTREILVIQEKRLDSLRHSLYSTDSRLAVVTNQNQNVVDANGPIRQNQLTRNSTYLSNQYFLQMNNVENLRMLLINQTPLFTILEPIRLPLLKYSWHIGENTTLGCILGFIVVVIYLIIRKTFRDILAQE